MDERPKALPSVLIIDDEKGLRDMLLYSLPGCGYEVAAAESGTQGLEMLEKRPYDLVVCDIMMPEVNGVETLRRGKKLFPAAEFIMATGFASLETAIESMKLGAYDYIAKPYDMDQLCAVLGRAYERKRLKDEVGELQQLNRLKSEFLANMSHELRTPLTAIIGYTSLILDETYGEVPEMQKEALGRVFTSSKNLLSLINDVLDLSKLSAGMMPLFLEEFDLRDVAREVSGTMTALALGKGIRLGCDASAPLRVKSDKTKIKQILINLVGNAIKFASKGSVTIQVRPDAQGTGALLSVLDTGPGIDEKDQKVIFDDFRQLDGSSRREHGGTGLGLAITRKLVRLLGGAVSVRSKLGKGAAFTVTLPMAAVAPPRFSQLFEGAPGLKKDDGKILLAIDDDQEVLRIISDSLTGTGCKMVGALGGDEGDELEKRRNRA